MKSVILLVFLLFGQNVFSNTKDVYVPHANLSQAIGIPKISLNIDKLNLGRAWVTLNLSFQDFDSQYSETIKVKIPGLFHDLKTGEIKIVDENKTIICAQVIKKDRNWFTGIFLEDIKIKETKACKFSAEILKKTILEDTSFDIVESTKYFIQVSTKF